MMWVRAYRNDPQARAIADRHYNRQSIGAPGFVPPGRCLVLLTRTRSALWVTSWPEFAQHRWVGAWVNTLFRNEGTGGILSSALIVDAVAATRWTFGDPPALGMVTFIDREKTRQKRDPGYCYLCAGFEPDGTTEGGLVALRMKPAAMPAPAEPASDQLRWDVETPSDIRSAVTPDP